MKVLLSQAIRQILIWSLLSCGVTALSAAAPVLTGKWRVDVSIPQGQAFAGSYILSLDLLESDGQLSGTGTWNVGVASKFTGSIAGGRVLLNRLDADGYRQRFVGREVDANRFEGTFDQSTNGATGSFVMTRVSQVSPTATVERRPSSLTGKWRVDVSIPQGQQFAGSYTFSLDLMENGGQISGSGAWTGRELSKFTGSIAGGRVLLNRLDADGYRQRFVGREVDANRLEGTFDQSSNGATGSFVLTRVSQVSPTATVERRPSSLTGKWRVDVSIPQGQQFAGSYTFSLDLVEDGGQLSGSGAWTGRELSKFTGNIVGGRVLLNRLDADGYRQRFVGREVDANRLEGTFDQSSNGATGSFVLTRVR